MVDYGKFIKAAREKAGLTQEQLGEKIGVTGVTIMRYEKGLRQPKLNQLRNIAKALEIPITSLLPNDSVLFSKDALNNLVLHDNSVTTFRFQNGELKTIHAVKDVVGDEKDRQERLEKAYYMLTDEGRRIAVERIEELTQIPKYQRAEPPESFLGEEEYTDTTQKEKPPESLKKPLDGK